MKAEESLENIMDKASAKRHLRALVLAHIVETEDSSQHNHVLDVPS